MGRYLWKHIQVCKDSTKADVCYSLHCPMAATVAAEYVVFLPTDAAIIHIIIFSIFKVPQCLFLLHSLILLNPHFVSAKLTKLGLFYLNLRNLRDPFFFYFKFIDYYLSSFKFIENLNRKHRVPMFSSSPPSPP